MTEWHLIKERPVPRHQDVQFAVGERVLGIGRACYGLHAPWYLQPNGEEWDTTPTHWALPSKSPDEAMREQVNDLWMRRHDLTEAEWLEAAPVLLGYLVARLK